MEAATQKVEPRRIQSRVGKRPIVVPKGITVALKEGAVRVEGPKGKLSRTIPAEGFAKYLDSARESMRNGSRRTRSGAA